MCVGTPSLPLSPPCDADLNTLLGGSGHPGSLMMTQDHHHRCTSCLLLTVPLALALALVSAAPAPLWLEKSPVIYHLLTDRFARTSANDSSPCLDLSSYCGGTWSGVARMADYLQGRMRVQDGGWGVQVTLQAGYGGAYHFTSRPGGCRSEGRHLEAWRGSMQAGSGIRLLPGSGPHADPPLPC